MLLNDRYEYNPGTDLIGTGGFGKVFRAKDVVFNRMVALKVSTSENTVYNLIEEARKGMELRHKNLVSYYDAFVLKSISVTGENLETQVGVMELCSGDIAGLNWNELSEKQQITIAKGILSGLHFLHQAGIIHRDIKPANVLLAKEGNRIIPKLTDFGISKERGAKSASVSRVVGSFAYMAPEQFEKEKRIDYNTDLWAFGI